MSTATNREQPQYQAVIVGAGVCGLYQLHRLLGLGWTVTVLESGSDLGGTWFWNRYPGARFDSESYSYGYSFSKELLQEWDWKERFSAQPETRQYLNYVAEKFDLRRHMQFNCKVDSSVFDEENSLWRVRVADGREITCRFLITAIGLLSAPTLPRYEGMASFQGPSFHTSDWPVEPLDLAGKRVAIIGTGATGVQIIPVIAAEVGELTVFQRRPNWCAPLHNAELSAEEMADIKTRYDEIFALCARTPGAFIHEPDPRLFAEVPREERLAFWEKLYGEPGFGLWLGNFVETYVDAEANAELSAFVADKIRSRVKDPVLAEKLIPKDHGFGIQRVPMETRYYEAYNRDNVHLVDLQETPIERVTPKGIQTTDRDYEFDIIVYATGFDAVTGAYDRIDIRGTGGLSLREKWRDGPSTFLGFLTTGFPNLIMPMGPQSGSGATNFPRGIEVAVNWATGLLEYTSQHGFTRLEATPEAEEEWKALVSHYYAPLLQRTAQNWTTGYNSNVEGHERGKHRQMLFFGGAPVFKEIIGKCAADDYAGIKFD